ncbi:hypothetical protein DCAR_0728142 [Daucus carota subsp. sativus]|uniref:Uncharacterized protein n=1 Tax=Daucus carota subsp. sativus TaxID=79200 RepID=A0A164T8X4_DAUCS|nr:hypothetical protein DCAR_0728142 [Daucus carota subsp. sativus]
MKRLRTQDNEILGLSEDTMKTYASNANALQISPIKPGVDYGLHRKKSSATIRSHAANTKPTKQTPKSAGKADFRCWNHLPADLLRPDESMFTYFMTMAQRLGNQDAEFYWVCKSVVLRNHVCYDILDISYKIIQDLSTRGHMLSSLFKNMMDIYFFPKKRRHAVTAIAQMITTPTTRPQISSMILALKKIGGHIYPDTIFDKLSGSPICNAQIPNEDNHYTPDGYPVHPDQMDDFTCLHCKVVLLMGCLSAYLTQSIDFYLHLF